jgi:hypothetical protein
MVVIHHREKENQYENPRKNIDDPVFLSSTGRLRRSNLAPNRYGYAIRNGNRHTNPNAHPNAYTIPHRDCLLEFLLRKGENKILPDVTRSPPEKARYGAEFQNHFDGSERYGFLVACA